jgi:predicted pyridoxine 5'-phosphate oxidase superfamily flavin-nucleotide-binding protein
MVSAAGYSSDIAFTPTVKDIQARRGSRHGYAQMEEKGGWRTRISDDLKAFIEAQTSVFLATANKEGQPYIQHRGGPAGFLRVIDDETIAFVDFAGNRQYITTGNLAENSKAYLFLIDYALRQRIKIWGEARVVEGDAALTARLMPEDYKARPEQVILFTVSAWDTNCPQHIPQKFDAADVAEALAKRDERIAELEAELAKLSA